MDVGSAEITYLVVADGADVGTLDDEGAFNAVVGGVTNNWNGIPVANVDVRNELIQGSIWEVAAIYGFQTPVVYQQATTEYEFSYQAPSEKIYQSLATVGVYTPDGPIATNTFGSAINVKREGAGYNVEGLDLPAGSITSTWTYAPLPGTSLRSTYEGDVESVMGDVASTPFFGRPYGTMRFVGCQGGTKFSVGTNSKTFIRFGFQYSRNRSSFTAGGILIGFKGGHNLMWGYIEDDFNNDLKSALPKYKAIAVEQVFFESNLRSILGIG